MFKEGTCPKCHEKIQVPDDREKIICMYCGQEIRVNEALEGKKEIDYVAYGENYNRAMAEIQDVVWKCYDPMKSFKKDQYEGNFESFYSSHRSLFEAIEYVYRNDEQPDAWLVKLTDQLIKAAKDDLAAYKFKGSRNQRLLDLNLLISVYFVPASLKYPASFSEPFADCLLKRWNEEFKTNVGRATFDEIENGFHRKLCYITTAVCDSLGKGLDCYELQVLKDYRDNYLEPTPEGHALVEEYYDIAPTIVKRMDRQDNRDVLYKALYEDYVMPCIQDIESQEYEACREKYQEMVLSLKAKYLN